MRIPRLDYPPWEGPWARGPSQGEESNRGIRILQDFMYFLVYFGQINSSANYLGSNLIIFLSYLIKSVQIWSNLIKTD